MSEQKPDGGPIQPPALNALQWPATDAAGGGGGGVRGGPIQPPNKPRALVAAYASAANLGLFLNAANANGHVPLGWGRDRAEVDAALARWASDIERLASVSAGQRILMATQDFVRGLAIDEVAPKAEAAGTYRVSMGDTVVRHRQASEDPAQRKAEIAALRPQRGEGLKQLLQIACEAENPVWPFVLAMNFLSQDLDTTGELLDVVNDVVSQVVYPLKSYLNVKRPSVIDTTLQTLLPVPPHSSFPSGHATDAYAFAVVLAAVTGAPYAEHETIARAVATHREWAGLHTPTDTAEGQALGTELGRFMVAKAMGEDPAFASWRALFAMASKAWRKPLEGNQNGAEI